MPGAARARTVADRIHETVARLLQGRIKDPRLGFVTVTDVRVTGDLQQATVFYTVYGSDEEREETAKALRSAKGLIRSEVGKALGIRLTPSLSFQLDALPTTAKTLEDALAQARVRERPDPLLLPQRMAAGPRPVRPALPWFFHDSFLLLGRRLGRAVGLSLEPTVRVGVRAAARREPAARRAPSGS